MQRRPLPNGQWRWREVIVQTRVLIILKTDTVRCAGRTREKGCGRPPVQIVNNVVASTAQCPRQSRARRCAVARQSDDAIYEVRSLQHWRNPVFKKNIDLYVRQKSSQSVKRRRRQDRVANRSQSHHKQTAHFRPLPARRTEGLPVVCFLLFPFFFL